MAHFAFAELMTFANGRVGLFWGQDIYIGEGKYQPDLDEGKQLLAYELTHMGQQTGSGQA